MARTTSFAAVLFFLVLAVGANKFGEAAKTYRDDPVAIHHHAE